MAKYLLIESRDPFESNDVTYYYDLAADLAKDGNDVTLFLLQNGVFSARAEARHQHLSGPIGAGVAVLADEFSLRERAISQDELAAGVKPAHLEVVVDQLAQGRKAMWH